MASSQYSPRTNNPLMKDLTIFVGLVIDQVLDIERLHSGAKELISQWPVLGGKVLTKTSPYSIKSGDTVDFKSRSIPATRLEYFPLDFQTTNTTEPSFCKQPNGSRAVERLFHFDSIQPLGLHAPTNLAIRVTVLEDATLFGFRVPHFLSDSQTLYDIVAAYTQILAGKSIPRLVDPPDVNVPASTFIEDAPVNLPNGLKLEDIPFLHTKDVVGVGIIRFAHFVLHYLGKRLMWTLFKSTRSEEKFIHLPKLLVTKWKAESQKELDGQDDENGLKVTDLDVITSWLLQNTYDKADPTPIDLTYEFSYRHIFPLPEEGTTYLKASQYELRVTFPNPPITTQTQMAASIRTTVLASCQPSIIKENLEYQEAQAKTLFSPRVGRMAYITSWGRDDFFGLDFSGAVARGNEKSAKVVFVLPRVVLPVDIAQEPFATILKNGKEGYWLRVNLFRDGWKGFGLFV